MTGALVILAILIIACLVIALVGLLRGRARRTMHQAAAELGLKPGAALPDNGGWQVEESFSGNIEGVEVTLAVGTKIIAVHTTATQLHGILIYARMRRPLALNYEITRSAALYRGNLIHPDGEFSRICRVQTDDEAKALLLLDKPNLRLMIRQFIDQGSSVNASLDQHGCTAVLFDGAFINCGKLIQRIRRAALVAGALDRRADEANLLRSA